MRWYFTWFWFLFHWWLLTLSIHSKYLLANCNAFFRKMSPLLNQIVCLYAMEFNKFFYILDIEPLSYILVLLSCSVVPDSLWCHGLQHSRFPCPSLSPRVCSNWCPLTWWCHLTILSSVIYMICKYFLPLSRQCFNFIHSSSCGSFLVWHSLTCLFWFFNFYFWGQI